MEIGMLWYDDSPVGLKDRVERAADYYKEKYGRQPNLCFVHPDMLKTEEGKAKGVVIRKGKGIMPGHFWIGVDESQVKKNGDGKAPKTMSTGAKQAKTASSKADAAPAQPKSKAKPASAKAAQAKPKAKAKSASAKPQSASAKPKKRKQALLKKKSGSRVKVTNKSKSKAKS